MMKKLTDLLEHVEYKCLQGTTDKEITGVVYDSRKAEPGCLFLCIKGAVSDGHSYAASVAEKGAAVLVVQDPVDVPKEVTVLQVKDSRYAMACIAAAWFDYPAKKLKTIGITGTKGKTTTTYLVKSILENAGHKTGLIGTIETIIGDIRRNQQEKVSDRAEKKAENTEKKGNKDWKQNRSTKLKFTFKEQREYETIDDDIAALEEKIAKLDEEIMKNATNSGRLNELMKEKEDAEEQLEEKMDRWVYLNDLAERIAEQGK